MPLFFTCLFSFKYIQSFLQSSILSAVTEVLSNNFFNAVCTFRLRRLYKEKSFQHISEELLVYYCKDVYKQISTLLL
jgi:hypothetical protein